ncbi:right-handed parallel beta-helix repeat-containing protein [Infirmifilum sp. NZ]|uniref:right-handed parallel beta-helix repeat-containing protein n=1 Tax=Infirmifilum sp. NZ TaxID=2926850 RepID=UPI0027A1274F|nr:NosD domain-containing protein [Infirmifilum sp. NZ]UNQ73409.1 right-handed parallel beta-helix repeat-containing protein [Infirmifilum sp. NZ]
MTQVTGVKLEPRIIYIRSDGSVDPPTAPILRSGNTYTLTDDIAGFGIVVEKDNIVLDGAGHILSRIIILSRTISGENITWIFFGSPDVGVDLTGRVGVTVKNLKITGFKYGIFIEGSSNILIIGNNITSNDNGVTLKNSEKNIIKENLIINNLVGITLYESFNNIIADNEVAYNKGGIYYCGILLEGSRNNTFYHNNFIDNWPQVHSDYSTNFWDIGYPLGGNYWSDYTGVDNNGDGVGDTPYVINEHNLDRYPLMKPLPLRLPPLPPVTVKVEGLPPSFSVPVYINEKLAGSVQGEGSRVFDVDDARVIVKVGQPEIKTNSTIYRVYNESLTVYAGDGAVFRYYKVFYVSVVATPPQASVGVQGSGWYLEGSTARLAAKELIEVSDQARLRFTGWSTGSSSPEVSFTVTSPLVVEARYEWEYRVEVRSDFGVVFGSGWYRRGDEARVGLEGLKDGYYYASDEKVRYRFQGWRVLRGSIQPPSTPILTLKVDGPVALQAEFGPPEYYTESNWFLLVVPVLVAVPIVALWVRNRRRLERKRRLLEEFDELLEE